MARLYYMRIRIVQFIKTINVSSIVKFALRPHQMFRQTHNSLFYDCNDHIQDER